MSQKKFTCIGSTALRDPETKEFLTSVPLYVEATSEMTESESKLVKDVGKLFAEKMCQYIDAGGMIPHKN